MRRLRLLPSSPTATTPDPLSDALGRAGRGDETAFAEVYDLAAALVYGVVKQVVHDPSIAEEVTQEVFVEIWRLAPRFDPERGSARSWIHTIARRRAVDQVRSEQSRRNREHADGARSTARPYDTVTETVDHSFERQRVHAALQRLSEPQREAVSLAYFGGHTYREVAALLDVAEGTIKTRIRDGMTNLRDHLGTTP